MMTKFMIQLLYNLSEPLIFFQLLLHTQLFTNYGLDLKSEEEYFKHDYINEHAGLEMHEEKLPVFFMGIEMKECCASWVLKHVQIVGSIVDQNETLITHVILILMLINGWHTGGYGWEYLLKKYESRGRINIRLQMGYERFEKTNYV